MDIDYILPKLRNDVIIDIPKDNTNNYIIISDPKNYAIKPIALPNDALNIINMLDGKTSYKDLKQKLQEKYKTENVFNFFLEIYIELDKLGFLETPIFFYYKNDIDRYLANDNRAAVCAGNVYSNEAIKLEEELNNIMQLANTSTEIENSNAIIVPHLGFHYCNDVDEAYSNGYNSLNQEDTDLFVIFGTAHYAASDLFMFTKKHFETPLGIVETDIEIIDELKTMLSFDLKIDDLAHRLEHSIELQTVMLKAKYKNNFKILPILAGSLYSYFINNKCPFDNQNYNEILEKLDYIIKKRNIKVKYIASADFSHVGRKFEDDFDAVNMLEQIAKEDNELIEALLNCDIDRFYSLIAEVKDKRKVCGLAPIVAMLKLVKPKTAKLLKYGQWNEKETKSAVSFASFCYY